MSPHPSYKSRVIKEKKIVFYWLQRLEYITKQIDPKFLHFSYFIPYASNLFPNVLYPVLADETAFALFWCQGKKYRESVLRACTMHKKIPAEFCKLKYKHCQGDPRMLFWLLAIGKKNACPFCSSSVVSVLAGADGLSTTCRKNII